MDDKYELKCHSTDNDYTEDKSDNVLIPEKKIISTTIKYSFKDFTESYIFQIIVVLILVFIIYYGMIFIFSKIGKAGLSSNISMKGGKRIR